MRCVKMTSVEVERSLPTSLQLQNPAIPESQQESSESDIPESENNSIDDPCTQKSRTSIAAATNSIKNIANVTNRDKEKREDEVIILDSSKEDADYNIDKIKHVQKTGKSNITSSVLKNDSKISKSDNTKDTMIRSGHYLKRKHRNFLTEDEDLEESSSRSKRKKKSTSDKFCWRCHKESVEAYCSACPRSWHRRCIGMQPQSIQNWICGECAAILQAENAETRSTAMAQLSIDQLCLLLKYVVERMREYPGSEPFWKPVELSEVPNYLEYVVKPMDLNLLESNVRSKLYGSTDAFMADAKWIQHNCIVFNTCGGVYTDTSKLTNAAKQVIKLARQEVSEIEACPDCYAHGRNLPRPQPSWFIEPCRRPHPLVWAKLKGFPFWPAKAMPRINSQGFVDVRFFGEHDRAWVSQRDLFLYSKEPPVPLPRKRRLDMEECVREITRHCRKLELVFGQFKFAPPKVQYNPHDPLQIKLMLPNYNPLFNNYGSSQFLIPRKKSLLKKRLHVKIKSKTDSETMDDSDIKTRTLFDFGIGSKENKIEAKVSKVKESDRSTEVELILIASDSPSTSTDLNETTESENKEEDRKLVESEPTVSKLAKKKEAKPSSSKIDGKKDINKSNMNKRDTSESNIKKLERNNNSENVTNDNTKSLLNLSKETITSSDSDLMDDVTTSKKEQQSLLTININKEDTNQNLLSSQKNNFKGTKNVVKVYKPKTRMVDKVNAEKALRSIASEHQKPATTELTIISDKQTDGISSKDNSKNSNNNNLISSSSSISTGKTQVDTNDAQTVKKNSADQSVALLFVVNNSISDTVKKSVGDLSSLSEKEKSNHVQTVQQQSSRDTAQQPSCPKKESKARKSFPNKARTGLQPTPHSSTTILSDAIDSMVYIPAYQAENCVEYEMVPPEAGPASARLYHGAHDLARKMAQLMEEAYKEASQENVTSENHQTTVHFLRLQMERMTWQHQQQLAELKHNTDRVFREMKASLEAERFRAIEETRKEAEEDKVRCIEEIKRKQWCAMCGREALFYCCWNTAYCDYPCQQSHWPMHMRTCAQKPSFTTIVTSSATNSSQQQMMPRLMINTQHVTSSSNVWKA
ncbi:protein kinase C-binding protein 1 isoform X2 [Colletes gigas]|uniref:protein kinase C-binding protein 1 isoform X2 n=1 Tax=Colletes gigas TaxID=935657 RepID=UPI001C9AB2EE|nr:protein kinase C-binding protein 1 isoform X2 [Colletes gigas]